jgi:DNA-binding NtrC family response regulator
MEADMQAGDKASILVVDDNQAKCLAVASVLQDLNLNIVTVESGRDALRSLLDHEYAVILLDVKMPTMDGFETAELIRSREQSEYTPIIFVTAYSSTETDMLRGYSLGAVDYIFTPIIPEILRAKVSVFVDLYHRMQETKRHERKRAEQSLQSANAEIKQLKDRFQVESVYLRQDIDREFNFGEIIGRSNVLEQVFFKVEQVAPQDTTVLLLGETGTGKGVVARAIHSRSARKDRPLVTVNCTALPANLIESELFGREKGAFTGSNARQMGRFEFADGGTIFLDEIGEMPMDLQTKLLRVVQDGEFERLGGPKTIKVNVRIIASTNRKLEEEIRNGRFREDLFYRLNVFPISIPPLRKRKEDIPLLVNYFVARFNKKLGRKIETVAQQTLNTLLGHHWPGNVRELESVIERAVITSQGTALQVLDRFETSRKAGEQEARGDGKALGEREHDYILQVLQETGWRIEGETGAAVILGLNPSTLRGRMRKYGIRR